MSTITRNSRPRGQDHFQPEASDDPQEQRRLRAHLEQIDYAAFAANREVFSRALPKLELARFERLALVAASARAQWIAAAMAVADTGRAPTPEQSARLAAMRQGYDELFEAYEAMRRLVERGYVGFQPKA